MYQLFFVKKFLFWTLYTSLYLTTVKYNFHFDGTFYDRLGRNWVNFKVNSLRNFFIIIKKLVVNEKIDRH